MTTETTDEPKKDKFKNHFIFCCSHTCMVRCMKQYERFYKEMAKVDKINRIIEVGEDRFMFFADINNTPQQIHGLNCVGFESCGHYNLSDEVLEYALAHVVDESPAGNSRAGLH